MLKFILGLYRRRQTLELRVIRWRREAQYWRDKYRSLKKWVDEIHNDFHSYDSYEGDK